MSLKVVIDQEIKQAMLAKEKEKLAVLRAIKAAILLEQTKEGGDGKLSQEQGIQILQKLHKQRIEAAKIYTSQNREDLALIEESQADIIEHFLPKQLGKEEVESILSQIIQETGASGPSDMGKVMGRAMGKLKGKAPGDLISSIVKELLNK